MMFGAAFARARESCDRGAQTNADCGAALAAQQSASTVAVPSMSVGEQLDAVKLKELLDAGILTQDEFDSKKKQILGL